MIAPLQEIGGSRQELLTKDSRLNAIEEARRTSMLDGWTPDEIDRLIASMNRRKLIAGALAAVALAGMPSLTKAQTPVSSGWSFTDDKGNAIELAKQPVNVIADLIAAAALWDFGIRPVGVFGWDVRADDTFNVAGGRVDASAVEIAGNETTPFDLERAAVLAPDLIVTLTDGSGDPNLYWSIDPELVDRARRLAPIAAINSSRRLDLVVARFAELAGALGADLASEELATAMTNADAAAAAFKTGVAASDGLSAMFIFATPDQLFIANPKVASDLIYFRELGLSIPDLDVEDTDYWETLSWEQSLKYPVDLVFYSTRGSLGADELKAHSAFSAHPALLAGQLAPWNGEEPLSYIGIETTLTNTLASIESATKVS